jgi:MFS family permease
MYLDGPVVIGLLRLFPGHARWAPIFGLLVMCIALAMSSFATNVTHLIATQGILYAIGGSIAYCPCILYMDEWFIKRKGLAYGIMWSGTGLAGVVLPLFLEYLLVNHGFQTTLRIWSGVLFAMTAPLAYYIKPRLPITPTTHRRRLNLRFVLSKAFVLHQIANVIEATGFFLPTIYLPSYAESALGASSFPSALTILLLNVASVFGCIAMGSLIDRFHVTTCILLSTIGATVSVFVIWGFSASLPILYVFSILYGLFAGSYTSTWPGIMKTITHEERSREHAIDPSMVFGCLAAGRGVGNVISGPLSEALVRGFPWQGQAASAYGSGFGTLIVFTGVTAFFGGASFVWKRIGWL